MKLIEYLQNLKTSIIQNQKRKESTPKVEIKDLSLKANIGHWLGIINNYIELTDKKIEEIELRFGELLKEIGISEDETCILSGYNKRNFFFNCLLKKKGTSLRIFLNYGDGIDFSPEMVVINEDLTCCYEYYKNLEPKLYLRRKNNGNKYIREFSSYIARFGVTNKVYNSFKIKVERPKNYTASIPKGFVLDNELELENYLMSLPNDANLLDVFDSLCEICFKSTPLEELNELSITLEFFPKLLLDLEFHGMCKITLNNGTLEVFTRDSQSNTVSLKESIPNYFNKRKLVIQNENQG